MRWDRILSPAPPHLNPFKLRAYSFPPSIAQIPTIAYRDDRDDV